MSAKKCKEWRKLWWLFFGIVQEYSSLTIWKIIYLFQMHNVHRYWRIGNRIARNKSTTDSPPSPLPSQRHTQSSAVVIVKLKELDSNFSKVLLVPKFGYVELLNMPKYVKMIGEKEILFKRGCNCKIVICPKTPPISLRFSKNKTSTTLTS